MRVFLLVLLFFAGVLGAEAQIRYKLGFMVGVNYTSLRSDRFTTATGRLAPLLGCSFVVSPSDMLELNQEVALTFAGADARAVHFRPEQKPEENTYSYNYYSFETSLFVGLRPGRDVPLLFQLGGYLGANFHGLDRTRRDLMILDYENINNAMRAVNLNDAFSGLDFGPAVGLVLGEGRFRATTRFYLGLKNLYDYIDFVAPGPNIRTSALRASLTYFLE
ncbi:MAG: hypothetical protein ACKVU2_11295 [Saprospiraceae bacterium]